MDEKRDRATELADQIRTARQLLDEAMKWPDLADYEEPRMRRLEHLQRLEAEYEALLKERGLWHG